MKKVITALTATAAISTYAFAQDAEASSHTVKGGDTIWAIAQNNNVSVSQLKSWNNLSSDLILVNQSLKVSGSSSSDSSADSSNTSSSNTSSSSSSNTSTGGSYTVKSGDTLSGIARANGMNYRTLMSINNISGHIIHPGQTLKLSSSASSNNTSSSNTSSAADNSSSASNSSSSNVDSSYSAPAPSSTSWGTNWYYWGDCTWYAFERRKQLGKPVGNNWGNASNWAGQASASGYTVNNRPSVGAIIQAHAWTNNAWGMGHVGVVERVNPDGSILISEMNFGSGQGVKAFRTLSASQAANHNFIH